MEVKAKLSNLRIAPRKVRLVAEVIRNKKVGEAENILNFTVKKGAPPMLKLLKSAVSNAKNNLQLDPDNLFVMTVLVDEGPKFKRFMPRARGRASEIMKRTSHITLILKEIKETKAKAAKDKGKKIEKNEGAPESEAAGKTAPASRRKKFYDGKETRKMANQNIKSNKIYRRKAV